MLFPTSPRTCILMLIHVDSLSLSLFLLFFLPFSRNKAQLLNEIEKTERGITLKEIRHCYAGIGKLHHVSVINMDGDLSLALSRSLSLSLSLSSHTQRMIVL